MECCKNITLFLAFIFIQQLIPARLVGDQITVANEVVMNGKEWSPTQARVFGMLLNKVVPDLNASHVQHEHQIKNLTEMSREELEAIASGINTIEGEIVEDAD